MNIDYLTSSLQKNCEINSNSKDYNNIKTILEEGCKNTLNNNNPEAVNYLYIYNNRGGSYKKSMNSNTRNCKKKELKGGCSCKKKELSGGCFTCVKGKKNINSHYRLIIIHLPKLYKKYKNTKNTKNIRKKKGGEFWYTENSTETIMDENSSHKMDDLLNLKSLNFKYKEYTPFDINAQISLS